MNYISTWNEAIRESLFNVWFQFSSFIPALIGALVVLFVGLIIASAFGSLVRGLVRLTQVDKLVEKTGVTARMETAGVGFSVSALVGWIAKWFIIVAVLIAVADTLQWPQVTNFLQEVALYIPNILIAVIILTIGLVAGQFMHDVVDRGVKASQMPGVSVGMLAALAKWAIIILAVMASLTQLNVATRLVELLFGSLVFGLSLAFGLAFGLGGQDKAKKWLEKLEREMK